MAEKNKVLICEDDTVISSMYKLKLEQDGYMVLTADNGADGLEMAKKEKPNIILLDVMMPQLDGFSVLGEIRNVDGLKKVPVLLLTNLGTEEDKLKGEKMGATEYLVKANLTPGQVSEVVKKYLK